MKPIPEDVNITFVAERLARGLLDGSAPQFFIINEEIRGLITQLIEGQMPEYGAVEAPEGTVYVPPGPFIMGADVEAGGTRIARLEEGFFAAKTPVTNAQYRRFVEAGGYDKREYWSDKGWQWKQKEGWTEPRFWDDPEFNQPDQPMVGVSWYEAEAYARWTGARLPTEAEWEKAARGIDGREYPWGEWEEGRCNTDEAGIGRTSPVGQFSPDGDSPYGAADMAGNVWEWMASEWGAWRSPRVLRGGSFLYSRNRARCAGRHGFYPYYRRGDLGFRVVVSSIAQRQRVAELEQACQALLEWLQEIWPEDVFTGESGDPGAMRVANLRQQAQKALKPT